MFMYCSIELGCILENKTEFILYQTIDGQTQVQTLMHDETVWLTQAQMVELFGRDKSVISRHISNIFEDGELVEDSVVAYFATTASDGKNYNTAYYNLDVIISVGYRVKSLRGTQFRQWATKALREYLIKGFVLDDARLENGGRDDYFDELVTRVRAIRVSERRFYQKITDIYATSIDYDPSGEQTQAFYASVQNKFHFAIHGKTAAEMIYERADATKPLMGLTSFRGDVIKKSDIAIAKNYLSESEIASLNRIVDQYLSFAEEQAAARKPMTMQNWIDKLHGFLLLNDRPILENKGVVSHDMALNKARDEYEKYAEEQAKKIESDFDNFSRKILLKK